MTPSILSSFKETLVLLLINLKVKISNIMEYFRVVSRYYSHRTFFKVDTTLLLSYLFVNPFGISKRFLRLKGEPDVYTYGETPLTTLDQIAHKCHLSAQDVVFELGCGRGRTCFWLNQFIGCSVVGIDYIPAFIKKAQRVKERFHIQGVSFRLEDLFQTDLTGATVIYLYGTCFSTQAIHTLIERFAHLPVGTKIITISYALTDYQPKAPFRVLKQFIAPFIWGEAEIYLQVVKHSIRMREI